MITNYSELEATIASYLNRSDLGGVIPTFIQLGEKQIKQKLRCREMIRTITITLADADNSATIPTGFVEIIQAQLQSTGRPILQYLQPSALLAYDDGGATTKGTPKYFSVITNSSDAELIHVRPATSAVSSNNKVDFTYYAFDEIDASTNTSNIVLTKHPEIYLFSSLANSATYLIDDERVQVWATLAATAMQELIAESQASFYASRRNVRFNNAT